MVLQAKSLARFAEQTGFPVDQVIFILGMITSFFIAIVYNIFLSPQKTSKNVRLLVGLVGGISVTWLCYASTGVFQIMILPTTCYAVINVVSPQHVHRYTFILAMGWLSCNHIYRQATDYGGYKLDITGPLMLLTQKVIYVAYALHDGLGRDPKEVTEEQKIHSIKKKPTLLEYLSYLLNFHTVLAGPVCTYHEYIDFIEGADIEKYRSNKDFQQFPLKTVLRKGGIVFVFLVALGLSKPYFPAERCIDPTFINTTSIFTKIIFAYFVIVTTRFRYYFALGFANVINNAAGMGFNGFDKNGNALWDKYMSCDIIKIEFATSVRTITTSWNISAVKWLRRTVYERTDNHGVLATFVISAFWHGFYPGYYLFFVSVGFLTLSSRVTRRAFRPYFQDTKAKRVFYDILTGFVTVLFVSYTGNAFLLLHFETAFIHWRSMYFFGHILLISGFASPWISKLLGMNRTNVNKDEKLTGNATTKQTNNNIVQNHQKTD